MATYDLLMIAILGGLTLYGYFKGMAWQVAYISSFVLSYFVAVRFADRIAPSITFVNPPANKFVAMLLIYAAASFAVWMVFRVVSRAIDSVKMEGFDHQMGAIIGFGRGVLWCVVLTFFVLTLPVLTQTQKQTIVASQSGRYIARLVDETDSLFPPEVHDVIGPYLDRLGSELHGTSPSGAPLPGFPLGAPPQQTAPAGGLAPQPWGGQTQQPPQQPFWPPASAPSQPQQPATAQQNAPAWPAPNPNWR